jgi:hypothetical protein
VSSEAFLSVTYSMFGVGAGLLSPAVTYGVMSSVPDGQAGVASGMNSSSRQVGQCLGVAVAGTVLDGSLHGPMQTGFLSAARGSWLFMAGCGLLVLAAGMAGNPRRPPRPRGRHARRPATTARRQRLRNRGRAIPPPPRHVYAGPLSRHVHPSSRY